MSPMSLHARTVGAGTAVGFLYSAEASSFQWYSYWGPALITGHDSGVQWSQMAPYTRLTLQVEALHERKL